VIAWLASERVTRTVTFAVPEGGSSMPLVCGAKTAALTVRKIFASPGVRAAPVGVVTFDLPPVRSYARVVRLGISPLYQGPVEFGVRSPKRRVTASGAVSLLFPVGWWMWTPGRPTAGGLAERSRLPEPPSVM
jgi:hypothetical protein